MKAPEQSSPVVSSQPGIHADLAKRVNRNLKHPWRPIIPSHTREAFHKVEEFVDRFDGDLIFDSGCGTGLSTQLIAEINQESLVIGIDKSASRLSRACNDDLPIQHGNIVWVRAELAAIWYLAFSEGWVLSKHYLLYPNPWPKPGHLQRRWHGHPVFPTLLGLGGRIELRTNWKIYADEFAAAVTQAIGLPAAVESASVDPITTRFERKYRASGHPLYAVVTADLSGVPLVL